MICKLQVVFEVGCDITSLVEGATEGAWHGPSFCVLCLSFNHRVFFSPFISSLCRDAVTPFVVTIEHGEDEMCSITTFLAKLYSLPHKVETFPH